MWLAAHQSDLHEKRFVLKQKAAHQFLPACPAVLLLVMLTHRQEQYNRD